MKNDNHKLAKALEHIVDDDDSSDVVSLENERDAARKQWFDLLQRSRLPVLDFSPITLSAGEIAHFFFDGAKLLERQIIDQRVVETSSGVTFYGDGMAFSLGRGEGRVMTRHGDVTIGSGFMVLTNQRSVFVSPQRAVSLNWNEVLAVSFTAWEVCLTPANQPPTRIAVHDPELAAWCCTACMNRRRSH